MWVIPSLLFMEECIKLSFCLLLRYWVRQKQITRRHETGRYNVDNGLVIRRDTDVSSISATILRDWCIICSSGESSCVLRLSRNTKSLLETQNLLKRRLFLILRSQIQNSSNIKDSIHIKVILFLLLHDPQIHNLYFLPTNRALPISIGNLLGAHQTRTEVHTRHIQYRSWGLFTNNTFRFLEDPRECRHCSLWLPHLEYLC